MWALANSDDKYHHVGTRKQEVRALSDPIRTSSRSLDIQEGRLGFRIPYPSLLAPIGAIYYSADDFTVVMAGSKAKITIFRVILH